MKHKRIVFLLAFLLHLAHLSAAVKPRYVILITIDGMRSEMIDDPTMPSPFLKMMSREGLRVEKIIGVPPAATYPSHTTIVTGALPARHRVFYNRPFLRNEDTAPISYWYADSIAVPTIWQRAHEAGMKTASLFWPVSTGSPYIDYNVPEFWSLDYSCDQMAYIKPFCTPLGILDELERQACGKLDTITFMAGSMQRDARTAAMANYLMNRYQPRLMTIHLITTDYSQHALGTESERMRQDVASVDNAVGSILENLRLTHRMDSTVVMVMGDHGFCDYHTTLSPNVWLTRAKLLSPKPGGAWSAAFHAGGNTCFLYLKKPGDKKTFRRIEKIIDQLPSEERKLFRVVGKEELDEKGADPAAVLAIEPVVGVSVNNNRSGASVGVRKGGTHGFLSGQDSTTLVAYGAGMEKGRKATLRQTEIAGWVLDLLGIVQK
ncbi:MAG: alkaline phosphatase family protein [Prevotella sp.]|nr:alkaline phosphatase family protein [Prevotella sp.]